MTKFMQLTVVFASLTTSVALVSVGPHQHGAHAKTTNMTRDVTLERRADPYYIGPAGGTSADCAAAITDQADCELASQALQFSKFYAMSLSTYQSGCFELSNQVFWNTAPDLGQSMSSNAVKPMCKHASSTGPPAAAANTVSAKAAVSAVGDPHMQNILGQRFDLAQPGEHTLLQIPRGASASDALLRVTADAKHEGGACSEMYFKALNITGLWVSAQQKDGYMYAAGAPQPVAGWRTFGNVEVKVAWGRTLGGVEYLNFMVRHLTRVGHDIGGLLGMDDYTHAAKRDPSCGSASLVQLSSAPQEASFAMADM